jgi:hypothetical protein
MPDIFITLADEWQLSSVTGVWSKATSSGKNDERFLAWTVTSDSRQAQSQAKILADNGRIGHRQLRTKRFCRKNPRWDIRTVPA